MDFTEGINVFLLLMHNVDVSSSDICDKDRKRRGDVRSISKSNTTVFILVQTLSKSNSPTSSFNVVWYKF
jgi:hypothetical protein